MMSRDIVNVCERSLSNKVVRIISYRLLFGFILSLSFANGFLSIHFVSF